MTSENQAPADADKVRSSHRTVTHPSEGIDMCVACRVEAPCPTTEALDDQATATPTDEPSQRARDGAE